MIRAVAIALFLNVLTTLVKLWTCIDACVTSEGETNFNNPTLLYANKAWVQQMQKGWQDLESRFRMMVGEGRELFCLYSKHSLEVANILSRHPTDTLRYNPLQRKLLVQCMLVSLYFPSKGNSASRVNPYPWILWEWSDGKGRRVLLLCIGTHQRNNKTNFRWPLPPTEACILSSTTLTHQTENYHQNALPYKPLAVLFQLLSPYYHPNHRHPMQAITVAQLSNMPVNKSRMKACRLQDAQEVSTRIP
jgi:hypothetical protein